MPYCDSEHECAGVEGLSNTFGTLSMSTSMIQNDLFPNGVTYNATSELFINTGNNSRLDAFRYVPICTIDDVGMATVMQFPSFGEVKELGGSGVSLDRLYAEGNAYIRANSSWDPMALTSQAILCEAP